MTGQTITIAADYQALAGKTLLSAVLLGTSENGRRTLTNGLKDYTRVVRQSVLPELDGLPALIGDDCDVLIIDLDQDTEKGLNLVKAASGLSSSVTVMVYSRAVDADLLVRCMQVGAREFLTDPLKSISVTEAFTRATARRDELRRKSPNGKCLVFLGAKGGSGVTTIASNFAVALANESGLPVALLDLQLQLGDAALNLGLSSEFSTRDALENEARLDKDLLSKMLVQHSSGLKVLAGPDSARAFRPTPEAVMKLVKLLCADFAYVVVDAGTNHDEVGDALVDGAEKVYLITQVSVVELRNSHRLIAALFQGSRSEKLEVVLNRFAARAGDIDEESIATALTVSPNWRIPSDFQAVHRAQNTASSLVSKDGAIPRVLIKMAKAACGKPDDTKKRRFGIFS